MATDRIYAVKNTSDNSTRLIEAESKYAALSYAVKTTLAVELASQAELVQLVVSGTKVEKAAQPAGE